MAIDIINSESTPIVVDWGTSNFRAYRFSGDGRITDRHQADAGILTITNGDFEAALEREIGSWFGNGSDIMLSGMITSRNGWVETPYSQTPATLDHLAGSAVIRMSARGARLQFLPGVATLTPLPDVMRGEEIQVYGAIEPHETATVVLPGTHSKWVRVKDGALSGFRTFMTGEMYALLKGHSILGRLIPDGGAVFDENAFLAGVEMAKSETSISLLNDIFTTRAGALLEAFPADQIADRLSGILLGHEIKAGQGLHQSGRLVLVGEETLTKRYALAFHVFGQRPVIGPEHATVEGFRRLSALKAP
jgi:2-dehydro-3-deoxygalactonokinase